MDHIDRLVSGKITRRTGAHVVLAALEEGDNAILVLQPDPLGKYRIVDINATFSRMSGYTDEQILGTDLHILHGSTTDANLQQAMDVAISTGTSLRNEIEYVSRTGRAFWFGFTLMPVVDPITGCLSCVILGRDITEKRRKDLEQSIMQAMLASVFQKVDAAVVIVRSSGVMMLANSAFQALLGYTSDELVQLTTLQITTPEYHDAAAHAHARQLATGETYEMDLITTCKDGRQIPVHLTSVLVQRVDMQRFRVVTLRLIEPKPACDVLQPATRELTGSINVLSLDIIKLACGERWDTMQHALLLTGEKILKRHLSTEDVYSRTVDQGFSIWFKYGTKDENTVRAERIGREIRVALLGDLGEEQAILASVKGMTRTMQLECVLDGLLNHIDRVAYRDATGRSLRDAVEAIIGPAKQKRVARVNGSPAAKTS